METVPTKLKKDAIAEALCELRFESHEFPELVVGRLASNPAWKSFDKVRLPASDIPEPVRTADPNLKFQPTLQLTEQKKNRIVKVGSHVISYHVTKPYCGWKNFCDELRVLVEYVYKTLDALSCSRFGFRYINILTSSEHFIKNIGDLNYSISIGNEKLKSPVSLSYMREFSDHHNALVKIVSPEFVLGNPPQSFSALIDVDVFTPEQPTNNDVESIMRWLEEAHNIEKKEFFSLIPNNIIDKLKEA